MSVRSWMNSALPVLHFSALSVWACSCRAGTRTEQLCADALSFPSFEWPAEHILIQRKRRPCVRPWDLVLVSNKCSPTSKFGLWYVDQLDQQLSRKICLLFTSLHRGQAGHISQHVFPDDSFIPNVCLTDSFLRMLITAVTFALMTKWCMYRMMCMKWNLYLHCICSFPGWPAAGGWWTWSCSRFLPVKGSFFPCDFLERFGFHMKTKFKSR